MSAQGPHDQDFGEVRSLVTITYTSFATLTIVIAEHILTLHHEYACLWKRKWTTASWLFLINRYVLLFVIIAYAAPRTSETCTNFTLRVILAVLLTLPYTITAIFAVLRIFALWGGKYLIPCIIIFLSFIAAVGNTYFQAKTTMIFVHSLIMGPLCVASPSNGINVYGPQVVPASLLISDMIAIIATWTKTYRHLKQAASLGIPSISQILLRDGSLYFLALLVLVTLQVLSATFPPIFAGPVFLFAKLMPNVLLGRFLINLRQFNNHETLPESQLSAQMQFASGRRGFHNTIVSMAAPLGEPFDCEAEDLCSDNEDGEVVTGLDGTGDEGDCP